MLRVSGIHSKTGFPVHLCCLGLALAYRVGQPEAAGVMWADYAAIFLLGWLAYCWTVAARFGWDRWVLAPVIASAAIAAGLGVYSHGTWLFSVPRATGTTILGWPVALALAGPAAGWLSGRLRRDEAWQYVQGLAMYRGVLILIIGVMMWSVARAVVWPTDPSWILMWLAGFMIPALLSGGISYLTGNLDTQGIKSTIHRPIKPWRGILFLAASLAVYHLRGGDLGRILPSAVVVVVYHIARYYRLRNQEPNGG